MLDDSIITIDELEKEENKKDIYKAILFIKNNEKDKAKEFIEEYQKENSENIFCKMIEFIINEDKKIEIEDMKKILPQIPKLLEEKSELLEKEDKKFVIYSFLEKI